LSLQPLDVQPPHPYVDDELRKVARDAYVSWQGSRYSVPWLYAGKQVWVHERGDGRWAMTPIERLQTALNGLG
jgi:hypothetical protein